MNRNEIYSRITNTILAKLKNGTVPWRRSWKIGLPKNFTSKKVYQGMNFLSLITNDFQSPYYMTYVQCKNGGGKINAGAKGFPIIYWAIKEKDACVEGKLQKQRVPILKLSHVFNLADTSLFVDDDDSLSIVSANKLLSQITNRHNIDIRHNTLRCVYSAKEDYISLPMPSDFTDEPEYILSLLHELVHWTGHSSRLNRIGENIEAGDYSLEELIAEIGSAYLCGLCGIENSVLDNQVAYINGWHKTLSRQPLLLLRAASLAQQAVDYLINF